MSTAFAAKNDLTVTRYLCLIEQIPIYFFNHTVINYKSFLFHIICWHPIYWIIWWFFFWVRLWIITLLLLLVLLLLLLLLLFFWNFVCTVLRSVFVAGIFLFREIIGKSTCLSCSRFSFNFLKNNAVVIFRPYILEPAKLLGFSTNRCNEWWSLIMSFE